MNTARGIYTDDVHGVALFLTFIGLGDDNFKYCLLAEIGIMQEIQN